MKINMLVVHRSEPIVQIIHDAIEIEYGDEKINVFCFTSADQAWDIIKDVQSRIHILIVDINLTRDSAKKLIADFKREKEGVFIVAISTEANHSSLAKEWGAQEFLFENGFEHLEGLFTLMEKYFMKNNSTFKFPPRIA